jgi:hypothetical protein
MNRLVWFSRTTNAVIVACPICGKNNYVHRHDPNGPFSLETKCCEHLEITQNEHEFKINFVDVVMAVVNRQEL